MAEKNSLWKNIRNKAKQNRKTGATPKKPTAEMLRQERKIKAQYAVGGYIDKDKDKDKRYIAERSTTATKNMPALGTKPYRLKPGDDPGKDSLADDIFEIFDPTGLTSWDDALAEDSDFFDKMSVIPLTGKVGTVMKMMKSPKTGLSMWHLATGAGAKDLIERVDTPKTTQAYGGNIYAEGGTMNPPDGVTRLNQPTRADSLFLLNNNKIIEDFIKNKGYEWETTSAISPGTWGPHLKNAVSFFNTGIEREVKSGEKKGKLNDYRRIKGQMIGTTDWLHGGGDDYGLPFQYIHPYITPQFRGDLVSATQGMAKPMVGSYGYDNLAITPWDMLTEAQKNQRVKKYGRSGVPKNWTSNLSTKPVAASNPSKPMPPKPDPRNVRPEISRLQSKQLPEDFDAMGIIGSPQQMPGTAPMDASPEGHYRVVRVSPHAEPYYQVWEDGKKWTDKSPEEFDKISQEKYLTEYDSKAQGGPINPYMYYAGGPMQYGNGGKIWKHIGAGAYALGEGILDTVTGGATDQLTDRGFEWLTKVGNKNLDLSDPKNAKFFKTQKQIQGYGNFGGAATAALLTGNVQGAVQQGAKGLNTAFQASDWATDDFKKWSNISSQAIGIGAGIAGGALNTEGASKGASEAAAKVGEIGGKVSPYVNQAVSMFGSKQQPMWQQAQAQQDLLNSPEYAAQQALSNQQYVNQGLSFAAQGGHINNEEYLVNSQTTMKGRYNNYKNRYAKGGTFNQYGIDMIPDSAGLHHESAYGGVPIGPNALAEGGEIIMDNPDGTKYVVSGPVDGTKSQMDFTFSKGGKYKELDRTLAEGMEQDLSKYSMGSLATNPKNKEDLRRPFDSHAQSTIDQIKQKWQQKTEFARQRSQQEQAIAQAQQQKQLIEEEYIAAYGGKINPKKYPGLNMPKKSKGGYVYNAMTEPMLAMGGPLYGNTDSQYTYAMGGPTDPPSNKLISNDKVLGYIADMNERGMLEPGKTFQPSWYSDLEKRQIDLNKELSPVDLGRVKSLYNYKQNNRNIFGFAQGGPMVSNVQQPFNGPAAQNRGGMMMAIGGTIPGPDNDPLSQYEQFYDNKMEGLMKFNPDSSDLGQDILEENNLPFEYRIREPELTNINPRTYPSKVTPGIVGSQQPMPGLSNDATFISPYQKYLAENKPKVLDNLTFLEAEDEDGINFEYGTISNPYRKKSPASNSTTPWYDEPTYSKIARYLPLAASAAGIATGLKNKKRSLTPERMIPQTVDLERSRITAMEEGRRALDAGLQGNIGSNMGQVAGNTRDMILNYNKNMGAQIAKIYESEANTNAQLAQQAGLANQQAGNQFKINNEEMFQNAQTMALRAAQEGAMLAQSGAEQERKQYLQEWIARNRLNTRSYKTNIDGRDVYENPNGQLYDEQGNPLT